MSVLRQPGGEELKKFERLEWEECARLVGTGYVQRFAPVETQIELFTLERENTALRKEIAARRARPITGRMVFGRAMATLFISLSVTVLGIVVPFTDGGRELRVAMAQVVAESSDDPAHPPTFDVLLADVPPAERTAEALVANAVRDRARLKALGWRAFLEP